MASRSESKTRNLELEPITVGSCFDDFDGDLVTLVPEVVNGHLWGAGERLTLYTYGSRDKSGTKLSHPATWNGLGALFWTSPPTFPRDEFGWVSIDGCVTNAPLLAISLTDVIRDAWVHRYVSRLNMVPWSQPYPAMLEMLHAARGSVTYGPVSRYRCSAAAWARDMLRYGVYAAKRPREGE